MYVPDDLSAPLEYFNSIKDAAKHVNKHYTTIV